MCPHQYHTTRAEGNHTTSWTVPHEITRVSMNTRIRFTCGLLLVVGVLHLVPPTRGHGRLVKPPSRGSMWRFGYDTPPNYNDNQLFCGGVSVSFILILILFSVLFCYRFTFSYIINITYRVVYSCGHTVVFNSSPPVQKSSVITRCISSQRHRLIQPSVRRKGHEDLSLDSI